MTILLSILAIIYVVLGIISFHESKYLGYGNGVSTMLGLLFPSVAILQFIFTVITNIMNFISTKFLNLILILAGTDREEYFEKLYSKILTGNLGE